MRGTGEQRRSCPHTPAARGESPHLRRTPRPPSRRHGQGGKGHAQRGAAEADAAAHRGARGARGARRRRRTLGEGARCRPRRLPPPIPLFPRSPTGRNKRASNACAGTANCAASSAATKMDSNATSGRRATGARWRSLARRQTGSSTTTLSSSRPPSWTSCGARTLFPASGPRSEEGAGEEGGWGDQRHPPAAPHHLITASSLSLSIHR